MSVRQNINELDIVHKNLEARLEELETRPSHVHHSTSQQSYQHQDVKHLIDDQYSLNAHQSLHNIQDLDRHHDQTSQALHVDPLVHNGPNILTVHSKHDHQPVHCSETITCSHKQEEPILPSTTGQVDQLPVHSSVDCSNRSISTSSDDDDESSNVSSNVFCDNDMDQPLSTIDHHPNNTVEGTINTIIHKSTSSTSVLSDSCVSSDGEHEGSSFEADGQPCYEDRAAIPLNAAVSSDQHHVHQVSMASNLTSVTPTDLNSLSDDESDEPQSSSGEDDKEQGEIETAANCESSEGMDTSPATSIVTQSLLNKNEEQQPQLVTDNLRDVTNSLSQPPSVTLHQEEEQTLSTLPHPSHTTVHKSPKK